MAAIIGYSDNSFRYYAERQREVDEIRKQNILPSPRRLANLGRPASSEVTERVETEVLPAATASTATTDVDTGLSRIHSYGEEGFNSLKRF